MECKRSIIVTSWSVTFFWVVLSLGLSILTIFSFLQADWIIKRNLIITNYYEFNNGTRQGYSEELSQRNILSPAHGSQSRAISYTEIEESPSSSSYDYREPDIETELLTNDEYFLYNEDNYTILTQSLASAQQLHTQRLVKITKVLITVRFGTLGICTSNPRASTRESAVYQCQLYSEDHMHAISSLWPVSFRSYSWRQMEKQCNTNASI